MKFLGSANSAAAVYVLHLIAQKKPNDWLVIGYKDIRRILPFLSLSQIGRIIRRLESLNWLISENRWDFRSGAGFFDQTKGYKIYYEKIFQDTSFNLLLDTLDKPAMPMKIWMPIYCPDFEKVKNFFPDELE